MAEALRRFYEVWKQAGAQGLVFARGMDGALAEAMRALGMELDPVEEGARLEFLSPKRGVWSGFWLERLPAQMGGEAVQRLFATAFLGLKPGAPLLVSFEQRDPTALLAWLRQAGFHALMQADQPIGQPLKMILARRV